MAYLRRVTKAHSRHTTIHWRPFGLIVSLVPEQFDTWPWFNFDCETRDMNSQNIGRRRDTFYKNLLIVSRQPLRSAARHNANHNWPASSRAKSKVASCWHLILFFYQTSLQQDSWSCINDENLWCIVAAIATSTVSAGW